MEPAPCGDDDFVDGESRMCLDSSGEPSGCCRRVHASTTHGQQVHFYAQHYNDHLILEVFADLE